jgi:hypothetical protein
MGKCFRAYFIGTLLVGLPAVAEPPPSPDPAEALLEATLLEQPAPPEQVEPAPPSQEERALLLLEEQRAAELEMAISAVKLKTIRARSLLLQGENARAVELADELLVLIDRLPPDAPQEGLAQPLREIIQQATGQHTAQERRSTPPRYQPGWPGVQSPKEAAARDQQRLTEQRDAYTARRADEADTLTDVERTRRIPNGTLTYPEDWPQVVERRREHADGTIYKGEPFRDANGEMVYTAIYDLRDLLVEVPDFTDSPNMDLAAEIRNAGDRDALRWRSQIFNGYPEDLAAGIPLLQFFGGVDELRIPPSGNVRRQQESELYHLINEVLRIEQPGN